MKITAFFDGSCQPKNPGGTASWGFIITDGNGDSRTGRGTVGTGEGMTNNVAEICGLKALLEMILENYGHASEVFIYGDSAIVIGAVVGKKKRPKGHYAQYVPATIALFDRLRMRGAAYLTWVPREQNAKADALSQPER